MQPRVVSINDRATALEFSTAGRRWHVAVDRPVDLAIPLEFDGAQPRFFAGEPAHAQPLRAGSFTGSVAGGASCNCSTYTVAPHCHGTHTECVGHVATAPVSIAALTPATPALAVLATVAPRTLGREADGRHAAATDAVIDRAALEAATDRWSGLPWTALVVRTLPNDAGKRARQYAGSAPAPYFCVDAMHWIVARGVTSLVVDLPSLDRADDGGHLAAHRIYWGLPAGSSDAREATRANALVTELAFVPDDVPDGTYLLDLHVPAFVADAAPSRPVLYPLVARTGDAAA